MNTKLLTATALLLSCAAMLGASTIDHDVMRAVYDEVRTPYKYGLVIAPTDNYHKADCPTVFRHDGKWLMTYVVYNGKDGTDGRGYETWLAGSDDLLTWTTLGRLLSYRDDGWDMNQRGGFPALVDWTWDGSYEMGTFKGKHWMTYIGGHGTGYEAVRESLNIGLAWTGGDIATAHEWQSARKPLLSISDKDAQWWEKLVQYKSTVYDDPARSLGKRFVMFYNAGGINPANNLKAERIGIALSNDLKHWQRYDGNPVFANEVAGIITGDAQIVAMQPASRPSTLLYVMFYFSAYNPDRKYNAYNTFAVSDDLIHWQTWDGPDLVQPSKKYDEMFAHKSCVVKHDGVVYHFYCAVNNAGQRGIALATSIPKGQSETRFPTPEPTGHRRLTDLNDNWRCRLLTPAGQVDGILAVASPPSLEAIVSPSGDEGGASGVTLPHNLDDYYGYRQLRHGNLHGSALYTRTFHADKQEGKRYFLQFEGIGTYATVTLNGHDFPRELVGRTVYTLDITDALSSGTNDLQVLVDHPAMQTECPWVCGGCSSEWGFSEGSQPFGIFRPVTLVETDGVRIEPFGVYVWNNVACDSVFIDTEVKNYTASTQTVELISKFTLKSGKQVFRLSETLSLLPGETKTVRQASPIDDAHRWSIDDPYLYNLSTILKRDGRTTDDLRTPFGIRSIAWPQHVANGSPVTTSAGGDLPSAGGDLQSPHRFYLNGKPVFINGTCEYEHLLGASHAFTHEQIASRIKQIRHAGFNAFREAHQPHNLYYQQLADEQGLLFWSQFSAHIWYDTPQFRENFKRLLVRWIKERRNSPSVVLWGLQNESVLPRDFAEECTRLIRELDRTASGMRLVTTCNGGEGTDWNVIQNWSGTYGGDPQNYDNELKQPQQLLNGEYGAWRTIDLHGDAKYSEESFTQLLRTKAERAESVKDSVCGHFQWLFVSHDNPGRTQPDGAYRRVDKIGPINHKGLLTIWEEPTPAYQMYRSLPSAYEAPPSSLKAPPSSPEGDTIDSALKTIEAPSGAVGGASESFHYLYRINCGGDDYIDEFGQLWLADDTTYSHSWAQDFTDGQSNALLSPFQASQRHITDSIQGTNSDELFQFFRFGRHRLYYHFAVPNGNYRIELYFAEPWHGKDARPGEDYEGLRLFDVAINHQTVIRDLDLWAQAGYLGAYKRVVNATVTDGQLLITFPQVKAGQAVIAAIAIATLAPASLPPSTASLTASGGLPAGTASLTASGGLPAGTAPLTASGGLPAGTASLPLRTSQPSFWHQLDTDTIAKLPAESLPQDTDGRPATTYLPLTFEGASPLPLEKAGNTLFTIVTGLANEYALRFRYNNPSSSPIVAHLTIVDNSHATLVSRDLTFPPTNGKFKTLSTTTGTQINAGTYFVCLQADNLELKSLEIQ